MTVSEKIKIIDNKIEQNKAQYNLDRQTAKISVLSSGNVSKYEFLPEKDLLEKATALNLNIQIFTKRLEYLPLGSELKKQTIVAEKQYEKEGPVTIQKEEPVKIEK